MSPDLISEDDILNPTEEADHRAPREREGEVLGRRAGNRASGAGFVHLTDKAGAEARIG